VATVQVFILQTLVSHLEIIDDQIEVVTDALEMFHFNLHLVDLFMERKDVVFSWLDVTLQLLNLVIKHELKLLEFLCLLFKLNDTSIFVFNGSSTGL